MEDVSDTEIVEPNVEKPKEETTDPVKDKWEVREYLFFRLDKTFRMTKISIVVAIRSNSKVFFFNLGGGAWYNVIVFIDRPRSTQTRYIVVKFVTSRYFCYSGQNGEWKRIRVWQQICKE